MKLLRYIFLFICLIFGGTTSSNAAISAECEKYNDCDMLTACELTMEVEKAISGLAADYEGAVVRAISYLQACSTYPDKFKKNIDATISEQPKIQLTINWTNVRNRMKNGSQAGFSTYDLELVTAIVDGIFGPDTQAQKLFFEALATEYIRAFKSDNSLFLDDAFVLDYLGTDDNLEKYRSALRDLTGDSVGELDTDYGAMKIDVTWDDVLTEISNVLDKTKRKRGAIVCENNRSYQAGIDAAGWIITAVAAIATFWSGGAGGAGVAAGRAAIGAGLKASAKAVAKVGLKGAAKKISKAGSKKLATTAVKIGMKKNMRGWATYAGKGVLKGAAKNFAKEVGKNLANKWTKLAVAGAAIWAVGKTAGKTSTASTIYSLVESDLDKSFLNCHDLDHNEGCYTVCGDGTGGSDYLNKYVLKPVLGKNYCVNPSDYALYEINSDGSRGNLLTYDNKHHTEIIKKVKSIQDKSEMVWHGLNSYHHGCDWNEDDIDMYFGFYIYDPDTLEITKEGMVIDDAIRLDD